MVAERAEAVVTDGERDVGHVHSGIQQHPFRLVDADGGKEPSGGDPCSIPEDAAEVETAQYRAVRDICE
jgi:hypothetical protein